MALAISGWRRGAPVLVASGWLTSFMPFILKKPSTKRIKNTSLNNTLQRNLNYFVKTDSKASFWDLPRELIPLFTTRIKSSTRLVYIPEILYWSQRFFWGRVTPVIYHTRFIILSSFIVLLEYIQRCPRQSQNNTRCSQPTWIDSLPNLFVF